MRSKVYEFTYFVHVKNSGEITWTNAGSPRWSVVKPLLVIVCANIPGMAPLLEHVLWGKNRQSSLRAKLF